MKMRENEERELEPLYDVESGGDDNLYTLPEDSEDFNIVGEDHSEEEDSLNMEYSLEEDEDNEYEEDDESDEEEDEVKDTKGNVISLMFKILSTPVEGWKELKRRKYTPEEVASGCFYPLTALASLSEFADKIYTTISMGDCLMQALYTFISFFFGYFTIMLVGGLALPSLSKECLKKNIGKEFVMMNLSTLALFYIANKLLPMIDAALFFLPIWTVYLIYKGVRILRIPVVVESRTKVILVFLIIGMPIMWQWLLDLIF